MAIIRGIDEHQVISYVMDSYKTMKHARRTKQRVWLDCLRAYMRYHDDEKWVAAAKEHGYSHRFFAAVWDASENLAATIGQSVWRYPDWLSLEPVAHQEGGADYDDVAAEHFAKALEYYFRIDGGQRKAKQVIKMLVLVGNCPTTTQWKLEPAADYPAYMRAMELYQAESEMAWMDFQQQLVAWQEQTQQAQAIGLDPPPKPEFEALHPPVVQPAVAYEGPTLHVDDLFNFVIDEPGIVPRPLRIKRVIKPLAWIKKHSERQKDGYILYDNLRFLQDKEMPPETGEEGDERTIRAEIFGMKAEPKRGVEIYEAQGDMIFPGRSTSGDDVFMSYMATVGNGNVLMRFEPTYLASGRCPTELSKLIDIPGEPYGMGLIEASLDVQDLLNRRMNQIVDAVSVVIYPEVKVVDDGVYKLDTKSGPGKKHLVGDLNNIQPLIKDSRHVQIGFQEVQTLLRWFQQLTRSANPYVDPQSESTATEVQRNETLKSVSFNDLVECVESSLISPVFNLFIDHIALYASDEVRALIVQDGKKEFVTISPEVVRRGWLVRPRGSKRAADEQRRLQNLLMFVELVTGNPLIMQLALETGMVDLPELLKMVHKELDIGPEEKVFRDVAPADIQNFMLAQKIMEGRGEGSGQAGTAGDEGALRALLGAG